MSVPPLAPRANSTMTLQWVDASGRVSLDLKSDPWFIDTKIDGKEPYQVFELMPFPRLTTPGVQRVTVDRNCIMHQRFVPLDQDVSQTVVNGSVAQKDPAGTGITERLVESDGVLSRYGEAAYEKDQMVFRYFVVAEKKGMTQFRLTCHAFADEPDAQTAAIAEIRKVLDLVRIDLAN